MLMPCHSIMAAGRLSPLSAVRSFSILIGMIVTLILTDKTVFSPGINFTSKDPADSRCIPLDSE